MEAREMTPQERDLLIAEWMGLEIHKNNLNPPYTYEVYYKEEWHIWNPSENAEQEKLIKAKLREWGCGYMIEWHRGYKKFIADVYDGKTDTKRYSNDFSESEAFLQAVEQLIDNLKTK